MSPDRLAIDEIAARRAMLDAPDDAIGAAYDTWIAACHAIEAEIRRTGQPLEWWGPSFRAVYTLGHFDSLHRSTFHHGRYRCSGSSLTPR